MLMEILAVAFLVASFTDFIKPYINKKFPQGTQANTTILRILAGISALVSTAVVYATSTPNPTIQGLIPILSFGLVSLLASFGHYNLRKNASGTIVVTPDSSTPEPVLVQSTSEVTAIPVQTITKTVITEPVASSFSSYDVVKQTPSYEQTQSPEAKLAQQAPESKVVIEQPSAEQPVTTTIQDIHKPASFVQ